MRVTISVSVTVEGDIDEQLDKVQQLAEVLGRIGQEVEDGVSDSALAMTTQDGQVGSSPFTRLQIQKFWRRVRGNKAGAIVATVAASNPGGILQEDLMRSLGATDGPTFGGYLSSVGHAVAGVKLPQHPLLKMTLDGKVRYVFDPEVAKLFEEFARNDGYYQSVVE